MQTEEPFAEAPISDFVGLILDGGEQADEAMYYVLRHRLYLPFKRQYNIFQHLLSDDFDDVLDDFFLYLRDGSDLSSGHDQSDKDDQSGRSNQSGKNHQSGGDDEVVAYQVYSEPCSGNRAHYPALRRIRNCNTFVQWLLRTFRNYLITRADREGPLSTIELDPDCVTNADVPVSIMTDEEKLSFASDLLAYALQEMSPRDGFILLRTLLTMLNKRQSLPNEELAAALGMTEVSYRVAVHRVKDRLAQYRTRLLQGESLRLDTPHRRMSQRINEGFLHLYPTLLFYYNQCVNSLSPNLAAAVNRLRQIHLDSTGNLLHEPTAHYERRYSKAALWNLLERFL